jgi:hypothetical protein
LLLLFWEVFDLVTLRKDKEKKCYGRREGWNCCQQNQQAISVVVGAMGRVAYLPHGDRHWAFARW